MGLDGGCAGFALCYAALLLMRSRRVPPALVHGHLARILGLRSDLLFGAYPLNLPGPTLRRHLGTLSGASMLGGALGPGSTGALYDSDSA